MYTRIHVIGKRKADVDAFVNEVQGRHSPLDMKKVDKGWDLCFDSDEPLRLEIIKNFHLRRRLRRDYPVPGSLIEKKLGKKESLICVTNSFALGGHVVDDFYRPLSTFFLRAFRRPDL